MDARSQRLLLAAAPAAALLLCCRRDEPRRRLPAPSPTPDLRTKRLTLRQFTQGDVPAVVTACSDLEVSRNLMFVAHPYTEKDADFFINVVCANTDSVNWAVVDASGAVLGTISVESIGEGEGEDRALGRHGTMGCWYGKAHWGQGYATEAAAAALHYVFTTLELDAVKSSYYQDNAVRASCQLLAPRQVCGL